MDTCRNRPRRAFSGSAYAHCNGHGWLFFFEIFFTILWIFGAFARPANRLHRRKSWSFAYSAIEEAEYDVLEAQLALDEAAELLAA